MATDHALLRRRLRAHLDLLLSATLLTGGPAVLTVLTVAFVTTAWLIAVVKAIRRTLVEGTPASSERAWAAASHLGVPFGSFVLPLIVWLVSDGRLFARTHAAQSFSYQLIYLPFHIAASAFLLMGRVGPLLVCMAVGFLLETPQMVRAMLGKPPLRLPPFKLLRS